MSVDIQEKVEEILVEVSVSCEISFPNRLLRLATKPLHRSCAIMSPRMQRTRTADRVDTISHCLSSRRCIIPASSTTIRLSPLQAKY